MKIPLLLALCALSFVFFVEGKSVVKNDEGSCKRLSGVCLPKSRCDNELKRGECPDKNEVCCDKAELQVRKLAGNDERKKSLSKDGESVREKTDRREKEMGERKKVIARKDKKDRKNKEENKEDRRKTKKMVSDDGKKIRKDKEEKNKDGRKTKKSDDKKSKRKSRKKEKSQNKDKSDKKIKRKEKTSGKDKSKKKVKKHKDNEDKDKKKEKKSKLKSKDKTDNSDKKKPESKKSRKEESDGQKKKKNDDRKKSLAGDKSKKNNVEKKKDRIKDRQKSNDNKSKDKKNKDKDGKRKEKGSKKGLDKDEKDKKSKKNKSRKPIGKKDNKQDEKDAGDNKNQSVRKIEKQNLPGVTRKKLNPKPKELEEKGKRNCKSKKKCLKADGNCVKAGTCDTEEIPQKCRGASCTCCKSKCSSKAKKKCTKKGGICKMWCGKKEVIIPKGCKGKKEGCVCCAKEKKKRNKCNPKKCGVDGKGRCKKKESRCLAQGKTVDRNDKTCQGGCICCIKGDTPVPPGPTTVKPPKPPGPDTDKTTKSPGPDTDKPTRPTPIDPNSTPSPTAASTVITTTTTPAPTTQPPTTQPPTTVPTTKPTTTAPTTKPTTTVPTTKTTKPTTTITLISISTSANTLTAKSTAKTTITTATKTTTKTTVTTTAKTTATVTAKTSATTVKTTATTAKTTAKPTTTTATTQTTTLTTAKTTTATTAATTPIGTTAPSTLRKAYTDTTDYLNALLNLLRQLEDLASATGGNNASGRRKRQASSGVIEITTILNRVDSVLVKNNKTEVSSLSNSILSVRVKIETKVIILTESEKQTIKAQIEIKMVLVKKNITSQTSKKETIANELKKLNILVPSVVEYSKSESSYYSVVKSVNALLNVKGKISDLTSSFDSLKSSESSSSSAAEEIKTAIDSYSKAVESNDGNQINKITAEIDKLIIKIDGGLLKLSSTDKTTFVSQIKTLQGKLDSKIKEKTAEKTKAEAEFGQNDWAIPAAKDIKTYIKELTKATKIDSSLANIGSQINDLSKITEKLKPSDTSSGSDEVTKSLTDIETALAKVDADQVNTISKSIKDIINKISDSKIKLTSADVTTIKGKIEGLKTKIGAERTKSKSNLEKIGKDFKDNNWTRPGVNDYDSLEAFTADTVKEINSLENVKVQVSELIEGLEGKTTSDKSSLSSAETKTFTDGVTKAIDSNNADEINTAAENVKKKLAEIEDDSFTISDADKTALLNLLKEIQSKIDSKLKENKDEKTVFEDIYKENNWTSKIFDSFTESLKSFHKNNEVQNAYKNIKVQVQELSDAIEGTVTSKESSGLEEITKVNEAIARAVESSDAEAVNIGAQTINELAKKLGQIKLTGGDKKKLQATYNELNVKIEKKIAEAETTLKESEAYFKSKKWSINSYLKHPDLIKIYKRDVDLKSAIDNIENQLITLDTEFDITVSSKTSSPSSEITEALEYADKQVTSKDLKQINSAAERINAIITKVEEGKITVSQGDKVKFKTEIKKLLEKYELLSKSNEKEIELIKELFKELKWTLPTVLEYSDVTKGSTILTKKQGSVENINAQLSELQKTVENMKDSSSPTPEIIKLLNDLEKAWSDTVNPAILNDFGRKITDLISKIGHGTVKVDKATKETIKKKITAITESKIKLKIEALKKEVLKIKAEYKGLGWSYYQVNDYLNLKNKFKKSSEAASPFENLKDQVTGISKTLEIKKPSTSSSPPGASDVETLLSKVQKEIEGGKKDEINAVTKEVKVNIGEISKESRTFSESDKNKLTLKVDNIISLIGSTDGEYESIIKKINDIFKEENWVNTASNDYEQNKNLYVETTSLKNALKENTDQLVAMSNGIKIGIPSDYTKLLTLLNGVSTALGSGKSDELTKSAKTIDTYIFGNSPLLVANDAEKTDITNKITEVKGKITEKIRDEQTYTDTIVNSIESKSWTIPFIYDLSELKKKLIEDSKVLNSANGTDTQLKGLVKVLGGKLQYDPAGTANSEIDKVVTKVSDAIKADDVIAFSGASKLISDTVINLAAGIIKFKNEAEKTGSITKITNSQKTELGKYLKRFSLYKGNLEKAITSIGGIIPSSTQETPTSLQKSHTVISNSQTALVELKTILAKLLEALNKSTTRRRRKREAVGNEDISNIQDVDFINIRDADNEDVLSEVGREKREAAAVNEVNALIAEINTALTTSNAETIITVVKKIITLIKKISKLKFTKEEIVKVTTSVTIVMKTVETKIEIKKTELKAITQKIEDNGGVPPPTVNIQNKKEIFSTNTKILNSFIALKNITVKLQALVDKASEGSTGNTDIKSAINDINKSIQSSSSETIIKTVTTVITILTKFETNLILTKTQLLEAKTEITKSVKSIENKETEIKTLIDKLKTEIGTSYAIVPDTLDVPKANDQYVKGFKKITSSKALKKLLEEFQTSLGEVKADTQDTKGDAEIKKLLSEIKNTLSTGSSATSADIVKLAGQLTAIAGKIKASTNKLTAEQIKQLKLEVTSTLSVVDKSLTKTTDDNSKTKKDIEDSGSIPPTVPDIDKETENRDKKLKILNSINEVKIYLEKLKNDKLAKIKPSTTGGSDTEINELVSQINKVSESANDNIELAKKIDSFTEKDIKLTEKQLNKAKADVDTAISTLTNKVSVKEKEVTKITTTITKYGGVIVKFNVDETKKIFENIRNAGNALSEIKIQLTKLKATISNAKTSLENSNGDKTITGPLDKTNALKDSPETIIKSAKDIKELVTKIENKIVKLTLLQKSQTETKVSDTLSIIDTKLKAKKSEQSKIEKLLTENGALAPLTPKTDELKKKFKNLNILGNGYAELKENIDNLISVLGKVVADSKDTQGDTELKELVNELKNIKTLASDKVIELAGKVLSIIQKIEAKTVKLTQLQIKQATDDVTKSLNTLKEVISATKEKVTKIKTQLTSYFTIVPDAPDVSELKKSLKEVSVLKNSLDELNSQYGQILTYLDKTVVDSASKDTSGETEIQKIVESSKKSLSENSADKNVASAILIKEFLAKKYIFKTKEQINTLKQNLEAVFKPLENKLKENKQKKIDTEKKIKDNGGIAPKLIELSPTKEKLLKIGKISYIQIEIQKQLKKLQSSYNKVISDPKATGDSEIAALKSSYSKDINSEDATILTALAGKIKVLRIKVDFKTLSIKALTEAKQDIVKFITTVTTKIDLGKAELSKIEKTIKEIGGLVVTLEDPFKFKATYRDTSKLQNSYTDLKSISEKLKNSLSKLTGSTVNSNGDSVLKNIKNELTTAIASNDYKELIKVISKIREETGKIDKGTTKLTTAQLAQQKKDVEEYVNLANSKLNELNSKQTELEGKIKAIGVLIPTVPDRVKVLKEFVDAYKLGNSYSEVVDELNLLKLSIDKIQADSSADTKGDAALKKLWTNIDNIIKSGTTKSITELATKIKAEKDNIDKIVYKFTSTQLDDAKQQVNKYKILTENMVKKLEDLQKSSKTTLEENGILVPLVVLLSTLKAKSLSTTKQINSFTETLGTADYLLKLLGNIKPETKDLKGDDFVNKLKTLEAEIKSQIESTDNTVFVKFAERIKIETNNLEEKRTKLTSQQITSAKPVVESIKKLIAPKITAKTKLSTELDNQIEEVGGVPLIKPDISVLKANSKKYDQIKSSTAAIESESKILEATLKNTKAATASSNGEQEFKQIESDIKSALPKNDYKLYLDLAKKIRTKYINLKTSLTSQELTKVQSYVSNYITLANQLNVKTKELLKDNNVLIVKYGAIAPTATDVPALNKALKAIYQVITSTNEIATETTKLLKALDDIKTPGTQSTGGDKVLKTVEDKIKKLGTSPSAFTEVIDIAKLIREEKVKIASNQITLTNTEIQDIKAYASKFKTTYTDKIVSTKTEEKNKVVTKIQQGGGLDYLQVNLKTSKENFLKSYKYINSIKAIEAESKILIDTLNTLKPASASKSIDVLKNFEKDLKSKLISADYKDKIDFAIIIRNEIDNIKTKATTTISQSDLALIKTSVGKYSTYTVPAIKERTEKLTDNSKEIEDSGALKPETSDVPKLLTKSFKYITSINALTDLDSQSKELEKALTTLAVVKTSVGGDKVLKTFEDEIKKLITSLDYKVIIDLAKKFVKELENINNGITKLTAGEKTNLETSVKKFSGIISPEKIKRTTDQGKTDQEITNNGGLPPNKIKVSDLQTKSVTLKKVINSWTEVDTENKNIDTAIKAVKAGTKSSGGDKIKDLEKEIKLKLTSLDPRDIIALATTLRDLTDKLKSGTITFTQADLTTAQANIAKLQNLVNPTLTERKQEVKEIDQTIETNGGLPGSLADLAETKKATLAIYKYKNAIQGCQQRIKDLKDALTKITADKTATGGDVVLKTIEPEINAKKDSADYKDFHGINSKVKEATDKLIRGATKLTEAEKTTYSGKIATYESLIKPLLKPKEEALTKYEAKITDIGGLVPRKFDIVKLIVDHKKISSLITGFKNVEKAITVAESKVNGLTGGTADNTPSQTKWDGIKKEFNNNIGSNDATKIEAVATKITADTAALTFSVTQKANALKEITAWKAKLKPLLDAQTAKETSIKTKIIENGGVA